MASQTTRKRRQSKKKLDVHPICWTSTTGLPKWRQSPIDISRNFTWKKKFPPLYMVDYWPRDSTCIMTNTGQTVRIEFEGNTQPILRGGPLKEDYQFKNLQFRWGPNNSRGAEHTIEGTWYSMEAQLLHWNTRYHSYEKCFDKHDGIAILSYPFQVVGCQAIPDNPRMSSITDNLRKIRRSGKRTTISNDSLKWMIDACASPGYYTYPGSLTVSPYTECVIWIITPSTVQMSDSQIDEFRFIYNKKMEHIVQNYRSVQNLRSRRILYASNDALD